MIILFSVKPFWPVQNKEHSIATYDFWTLHTNFPYNKLTNDMRELINFCFKVGGK